MEFLILFIGVVGVVGWILYRVSQSRKRARISYWAPSRAYINTTRNVEKDLTRAFNLATIPTSRSRPISRVREDVRRDNGGSDPFNAVAAYSDPYPYSSHSPTHDHSSMFQGGGSGGAGGGSSWGSSDSGCSSSYDSGSSSGDSGGSCGGDGGSGGGD